VFDIFAERPAVNEPKTPVQQLRGLERFLRTGFQAQTLIGTRLGDRDDVGQDGSTGATATQCRGCSHGFDLAMLFVQLFERTAAEQARAVPRGPESDFRLAQSL